MSDEKMTVRADDYDSALTIVIRGDIRDQEMMVEVAELLDSARHLGRYRGADGAPWIPYSKDSFERDAPSLFNNAKGAYFDVGHSYEARIALAHRPHVSLDLGPPLNGAELLSSLDLVERMVALTAPDLALAAWCPVGERQENGARTWTDARGRLANLYVVTSRRAWHHHGPPGLSLRTYLGPHLTSLFDHGLLLSTPGAVREDDRGGVWIDVVEDIVGTPWPELLDAWDRCMKHLAPAEVFSVVEVNEERKRIRVTGPGANYRKPPRTK